MCMCAGSAEDTGSAGGLTLTRDEVGDDYADHLVENLKSTNAI